MESVLPAAVAAAHAARESLGLHEEVTHEAFISDPSGGLGVADYSAPTTITALVIRKHGTVTMPGGQEFKFRAAVGFLQQVAIDPRDRLTLHDGMTGPLHTPTGGMVDPVTKLPYARTVYVG